MSRTVKRTCLGREIDFPDTGRVWTHVKTGGRYVVMLECIIEATQEPAVAYTSETPGNPVWIRPVAEFLDGRFV